MARSSLLPSLLLLAALPMGVAGALYLAPPPEASSAAAAADEAAQLASATVAPASDAPEDAAFTASTTGVRSRSVSLALGAPAGTIAAFTGVNMGPAASREGGADLTALYHERGLSLIRTHDFNGAFDLVDIQANGASFARTDVEAKHIRDAGMEIYLRLGNSYATSKELGSNEELVDGMLKMLRHVQEADPTKPVRYVELWNEPDNPQFWHRSPRSYNELYIAAARAVRKAYPDVKIGGPALTPAGALTTRGQKFFTEFLRDVKRAGVPLDFVTWHVYANEPKNFLDAANFYRKALEEAGFGDLEQHVTEWNTSYRVDPHTAEAGQRPGGAEGEGPAEGGGRPARGGGGREGADARTGGPGRGRGPHGAGGEGQGLGRRGAEPPADAPVRNLSDPEVRIGARAASLTTGSWIALQQGGVDQSFFYRGPDPQNYPSPFYGLFYFDGTPKPSGLAALLWKAMMDHPTRLALSGEVSGPLWALAGRGADGEVAVLLANVTAEPMEWSLTDAKPSGPITLTRLRAPVKALEEATISALSGTLDPNEVALVRFR